MVKSVSKLHERFIYSYRTVISKYSDKLWNILSIIQSWIGNPRVCRAWNSGDDQDGIHPRNYLPTGRHGQVANLSMHLSLYNKYPCPCRLCTIVLLCCNNAYLMHMDMELLYIGEEVQSLLQALVLSTDPTVALSSVILSCSPWFWCLV